MLMFKQDLLVSHPGTGSGVWDDQNNMVRRVYGRNGIQSFIYMNPTDGGDPLNNAIVIDGQALQNQGASTHMLRRLQTRWTPTRLI